MAFVMRPSVLRSSLATRPATRAFSLSARQLALSESDHSNEPGDRKATIDSAKEAQKKDSEWKKELASNSEAALKADRSETNDISKLQKETAEAAEKEKGKK